MKTTILSCLLISLLLYGNCTNTNRDKVRILNDSVSNAISNLQLHKDTIMLSRILPLCDSLIVLDDSKRKYNHILRKCQILTMLDRYEEALVEREKAANLLPPNDASRLEFYGFKYKLSGDTLQSNEYFLRALAECDKQIANNENAYITKKVMILIYLDRITEAKETLQLANQKNPKDEEIKTLLDNFDSLAEETKENFNNAIAGSVQSLSFN